MSFGPPGSSSGFNTPSTHPYTYHGFTNRVCNGLPSQINMGARTGDNNQLANYRTYYGSLPPELVGNFKKHLTFLLEFCFSRENLTKDAYLVSQMDDNNYVPITILASFPEIQKLTNDIDLITEIIKESPNLETDDNGLKVRPVYKQCIIIVREIPKNTPIEDIKKLFASESCPEMIKCEYAHNNSWYVTFDNDEDAYKAYMYIREEVKEFQGLPIKARIKTKSMIVTLPAFPFGYPSAPSAPGILPSTYDRQSSSSSTHLPPTAHSSQLYYTGPSHYMTSNNNANEQQQKPIMIQYWADKKSG